MNVFVADDHYHRTLKVFLKFSNEREANPDCLRQHLPNALRKLQLGEGKRSFNILSIGAGEGFMDHEILKIVEDKYLNAEKQLEDIEVLNTAIEPMGSYEMQYREYFESRGSSRKGSVRFEFKPETFESYIKSKHDKNQYHMVQAIHSLYFVDSLESTLNHCYYDELGDKGLIVSILLGQGCVYNQLREAVNKTLPNDKKKELVHVTGEIVGLAQKNRWEFARFACNYVYDVTEIVKKVSEDGKLLLDFLMTETNFFDTSDKESVDAVCNKLREISTEEDDGRMIVKEINELIIIFKKPLEK